MTRTLSRLLAGVAAGALLAVVSGGASAGVATADPVGGHGSSSTQAVGSQVLKLRDQLTKVAYAGDVAGTQRTLNELTPLLGDLSAGQRYSIESAAQGKAEVAKGQSSEASRLLANPAAAPRQIVPPTTLPPLPPPLVIINGTLQGLLLNLTALVASLLGPLPVPALPVPVSATS